VLRLSTADYDTHARTHARTRAQGYDTTIVPLAVTIVATSAAAVCSLVAVLVFHARAAFYARPLSYHADVLHQQ
jgi:multisubunit Na+/H+ antiporter MnhG subunit